MIYQTDPEFPADVYHFGCFGMCIGERVSTRFQFPFTHELMGYVFQMGIAYAYEEPESFIEKPQQFANTVIAKGWDGEVAGAVPKVIYLGKQSAFYVCGPDELEIQAWHTKSTDFNHFMSAQDGRVVYDPWSAGGSATAKTGKCVGKRVFRVIT
jgi:hypothetical protein